MNHFVVFDHNRNSHTHHTRTQGKVLSTEHPYSQTYTRRLSVRNIAFPVFLCVAKAGSIRPCAVGRSGRSAESGAAAVGVPLLGMCEL